MTQITPEQALEAKKSIIEIEKFVGEVVQEYGVGNYIFPHCQTIRAALRQAGEVVKKKEEYAFTTEEEGEAYMHGYFDGEEARKKRDWFPCDTCGKLLPTQNGVEKHKRYCTEAALSQRVGVTEVTVEELMRRITGYGGKEKPNPDSPLMRALSYIPSEFPNGLRIIKGA